MRSINAVASLGWGVVLALGPGAAPRAGTAEAPAVVAFALDTSGSVGPADLGRTRDLVLAVLDRLPGGSEVAVLTFDDQSRRILPPTSDPKAVRRALAGVKTAGRYTALYDAIYDASRTLASAPGARKAIILVTDGKDENSTLDVDDGLRVAEENRIPIFPVGVGRAQERILRRIAKLTGGEYRSMAQTDGPSLARRVMSLPQPAPPAAQRLPATPAAPPEAPPAAFGPSELERDLWVAGGILLALAGGALIILAVRRRPSSAIRCPRCRRAVPSPRGTCPSCGAEVGPPPGTIGPGAAPTGPREAIHDTVVARIETAGEQLDKTLTLRDRPVLAIARGPGAGQAFPLSLDSATSIGRARANDITLDDLAVSAQHCRIRPEEGRFVLLDLDSTNGTFVNERRVSASPLVEGDLIRIGDTTLQLRSEQSRM
jgi:FHA domain/von Willebrand factor type A domain